MVAKADVWYGNLSVSPQKLAEFKNILSSDELARSDRFKFPVHRDRYIAARGSLRCLLANYLGIAAKDIRFNYGAHGKPEIADTQLWFNLSHSEDMAIYCFSASCLVGVDLEYLGKEVNCDHISQRFFSQQEAELIYSLPEAQKKQTFFQLWTAKEAYLKAIGKGLCGGLDKIEVAINSLRKSKIIAIHNNDKTDHNWYLHCFQPQINYIATVATQKQPQKLSIQKFEPNSFLF